MVVRSDDYYKEEIEKVSGYKLIRVIRKNGKLLNGKVNNETYIRVSHNYCGNIYDVKPYAFLKNNNRCVKCCGSCANSFAYHIEVELGLDINDVWDFEKNTVNPYHISRNSNDKVWIKCQDKGYHNSYIVMTGNFIKGSRCPYCSGHKVHPKDSFAQYHIENTDPNFLEKYWDCEKNTVNPWEISKNNSRKVWIKCQNEEVNELNGLMKKDYHPSYEIKISHFTDGVRCGYCYSKKVHLYDSFGYHNLDKVLSWHPDNEISPFRVARGSNKKYKFICDECYHEWESSMNHVDRSRWCPSCSASKGEKRVKTWLDYNNISYIHDEPYFKDLLSDLGNPLRPDFILPEHKIWIEYDGEFHYKDTYKDGRFERQIENDKLKNEYAKLNDWKLIRIPYWDFFNVEKILNYEVC